MKDTGNLVRLLDLDPDFIIDMRYFRKDNFTGQQIYKSNQCYIDKDTAKRLIKAKDAFKKDGFRVKVWDAYRPVSAQRKFWEVFPDNDFVAYPPDLTKEIQFKNSHMNGQSVDITLTDMEGNEIPMPSEFDDFTERARLDCKTTEKDRLANALYMQKIMIEAGFSPYEGEWWHFYDRNVTPAPYSDFDI